MGAPGAATLQANRPPLLPGKLRGPWKVARLEMVRSAHMRKLQLAVERPFSGRAVICRPALLSGQTGNGLSCEGLRSRVVMRKLQLAADRFFSGLAAICGPALLSGQTGNGLSRGGLRSWLV